MTDQVTLLAGDRQRGETRRAMLACNDYLRMGPKRSLRSLLARYSDGEQSIAPTRSKGTLFKWSARYGWQSRADAYDAETERVKNALRQEVMESGLALDFERVTELTRLADLLIGQLYKPGRGKKYPNLWLKDVKQIGRGDDAERVDLRRFNAPLVSELRAALADLAAETGGRAGKVDITTGGGQAVKFVTVVAPEGEGKREDE